MVYVDMMVKMNRRCGTCARDKYAIWSWW